MTYQSRRCTKHMYESQECRPDATPRNNGSNHITCAIAEQRLRLLVEENDAASCIDGKNAFLRFSHIDEQGKLF